jgi:hypothetical protein
MRMYVTRIITVGLLLCTLAAPAFANTGSAVITTMRVARNTGREIQSQFVISNISSRDVQVTLSLFDQNGDPIGAGTFLPVITTLGPFTSCNGTNTTCTLQAGKTAWFLVAAPAGTVDWFGYGTLDWSTSVSDGQAVSLVATGFVSVINSTGTYLQTPVTITKGTQF